MKERIILLVDENEDGLLLLKECFSHDYQVISARFGKEVLGLLLLNNADVIFGCLEMDKMSGLDLFRQSRVSQPEAIRILAAEHQDLENTHKDITEAAVYQIIRKP